jgi:Rrf2 family nitric oxide-sensitive transcriptional repressor
MTNNRNGTQAGIFRVSEAANLGIHAMALLAGDPDRLHSTHQIAAGLRVSLHHLAKVMARLERAGLVLGTRGPRGGYRLTRPAAQTNLREVYEAVEGPLRSGRCMFGVPVCGGNGCLLGNYLGGMTERVARKLAATRLSQIAIQTGASRG